MYKYYLSIGSNIGKITKNLDKAIRFIQSNKHINVVKIAPYFFTPPLLPPNADESYYHIFCNTCIEIQTIIEPLKLLQFIKQLEMKMGRPKQHFFWSPRIIDIDILYCEKDGKVVNINEKDLIIPHKELFNRSFVLDPLSYINSSLVINNRQILYERKKQPLKQSVIMGIVNITNNSFSGDGILDFTKIEKKITKLSKNAIPIIDIGCEATNPKANAITANDEIDKLKKIINTIQKIKKNTFSTRFSIDTYHSETALFAIQNGFDIINDVNGFKDEKMWEIMKKYKNIEAIIMHSLTPYADKNVIIKTDNIILEMQKWVDKIKQKTKQYCIEENRIIIDYGIGFGKTSFQSLQILQNINKINHYNFRVLIGHSKKSFMSLFTNTITKNRIFETMGSAISLQQKGIDIIRLHDATEFQKLVIGMYNCW